MSQNVPTPSGVPDQPPVRRVAIRFPVSQPRLMYVLLAVNVAVFLYYFSLPTAEQVRFLWRWGKVNEQIAQGEYYRLFTAMFLHLNLSHILLNGMALYFFGRDVEALFGSLRFAVIYLLGGLSGSLASFVFTDALSVGASGAIFAIFGAELVYLYQHRDLHGPGGRKLLSRLLTFMALNLAFGVISSTGVGSFRIDNAGHIGGLLGGVVLTWFIGPLYRVRYTPTDGQLRVVDENPPTAWARYAALYAVVLAALTSYAVRGG